MTPASELVHLLFPWHLIECLFSRNRKQSLAAFALFVVGDSFVFMVKILEFQTPSSSVVSLSVFIYY